MAGGRPQHRRDRRAGRAPAQRQGRAAELVGRRARSRGRFRHLRLRAGLCDRGQRLAVAGRSTLARRRHHCHQCTLFRRSAHEGGRQSFPRFSGAVECGGVLSVPAALAAAAVDAAGRKPGGADLRAVPRAASGARRAAALADDVADRDLGSALLLHAADGLSRRHRCDCRALRDRALDQLQRRIDTADKILRMMHLLTSPEAWAALLTLTALEIVLGIDNVIFLSVIVSRIPENQAHRARQVGLALALIFRIILLSLLVWLIGLTAPVFSFSGYGFSWRDLILIGGGLFLIAKATHEIHGEVEARDAHDDGAESNASAFFWVIVQIIIIDMVFSLDSIITAIGMAQDLEIMIAAVIIACIIMYVSSGPVARFVADHPTTKMLALAFLVLIGVALVADGFKFHIPRGYIYFAIAFSAAVEFFNVLAKRNRKKAPH